MHKLFQLRSYITYWLDAVDKHSLHSPFFYDFFTTVVKAPANNTDITRAIEAKRQSFLNDYTTLAIADFGGGAAYLPVNRTVHYIARTSLSPARYSRLYARIARHFQCRNIVELGTSLGINTLYLTSVPGARVATFEGAAAIASRARQTFGEFPHFAIDLREGDLATSLPAFLANSGKLDLAFVDANHRYEPTIKYVHQLFQKVHARSVVILDDIHHSPAMEKAWNELRRHPLVYGSADLYRCGLFFFDPSLNKQHVVLQY